MAILNEAKLVWVYDNPRKLERDIFDVVSIVFINGLARYVLRLL